MSLVFRIVHLRSIFTTKVEEFVWRRKQSFLRHEWQPENRIFIQGAYIIYSHDNTNHKQRVNLSLAWRQNSLSNFERGKRVREPKRGNLSFIFLWGSPVGGGGGSCWYLMVSYSSSRIYMMTPSSLAKFFFLNWGGGGCSFPPCSPKYLRWPLPPEKGSPEAFFPRENLNLFLNVRNAGFWLSGRLFALTPMPSLQKLKEFVNDSPFTPKVFRLPVFEAIFFGMPSPHPPQPHRLPAPT